MTQCETFKLFSLPSPKPVVFLRYTKENEMRALYHKDLGLPTMWKTDWGVLGLKYSKHAQQAAEDDRYGFIDLPRRLDTSRAEVIEIELDEDECLDKILYRTRYNAEYDICIAVRPLTREVKTVWLNKRNDTHQTLDLTKYQKVA